MALNQYKIVLINLDPTIGSEIQKTQIYVLVFPNEVNVHLENATILAK
jgi:mRNA interferase MazF